MTEQAKVEVTVFMATSLDGYIARKDGDIAWLHEIPAPEGEDYGYQALVERIDAIVLGRGTFETVMGFDDWFYTKPVIVMSESMREVPERVQDKVELCALSPREAMRAWAEQGMQHVYLDGGKLVQSFLREGLVDHLILTRIPILIGEGVPLFGPLEKDVRLEVAATQHWDNHIVQTHYRVVK